MISKKLDERKAEKAKVTAKVKSDAKVKAWATHMDREPRDAIERSRHGAQRWTGQFGPGQRRDIPFCDKGAEAVVRNACGRARKEKLKLAK